MKRISLQRVNNKSIVNHIDKDHSCEAPLSKTQLLCIYISFAFQQEI